MLAAIRNLGALTQYKKYTLPPETIQAFLDIQQEKTQNADVKFFNQLGEVENFILEKNTSDTPSFTIATADILKGDPDNHKFSVAVYKIPEQDGGETSFFALETTRFGKDRIKGLVKLDDFGQKVADKLADTVANSPHVRGLLLPCDIQYSLIGCGIMSAAMTEIMCNRKDYIQDICKDILSTDSHLLKNVKNASTGDDHQKILKKSQEKLVVADSSSFQYFDEGFLGDIFPYGQSSAATEKNTQYFRDPNLKKSIKDVVAAKSKTLLGAGKIDQKGAEIRDQVKQKLNTQNVTDQPAMPLTKMSRAIMETAAMTGAMYLARDGAMYLAKEFIFPKNPPAATPTVTAPETRTLRTEITATAALSVLAFAAAGAAQAYRAYTLNTHERQKQQTEKITTKELSRSRSS